MRKYDYMKKVKQLFAPISVGRIRLIIRYYKNGEAVAFEGALNPNKNMDCIRDILSSVVKGKNTDGLDLASFGLNDDELQDLKMEITNILLNGQNLHTAEKMAEKIIDHLINETLINRSLVMDNAKNKD